MEMRDVLGYFAYKYNGDFNRIFEAIENKEPVNAEQIKALHKVIDYDFFTIVDDNYPELLKRVENPPVVMFYKGDISLINTESEIIAKQSDEGIRMIHAYDTEFTSKGIKMKCVMACECHADMDMLVDKMERAQDSLQKLLSVYHAKEVKDRNMQR